MILMQINHISKSYGADLILSNIKLEVHSNDRIAIVGRNGAGKSTLLKIMSGELSYDTGEIFRPKSVSIGYLAQHTGLESSQSIWQEMEQVFHHLKSLETELRTMEQKMAEPDLLNDQEAYQQLLSDYDKKQQAFKQQGGYQYEADIKSVLNGLHFQSFDYETPISTLSGGQKTRLALGKLLLSKPDVLILDEPTNHLDIETLTWLEQYLQSYPGAVLIVSHDRYFLDKIVNVVYEISFQTSIKFHGNYTNYLEKKAESYEQEIKQFEKQQSEIKKLETFIQKNIARATTTKRAQSRRKQLEKMDKVDKPKSDDKSAKFSFNIEKQSGNDVLKLRDLSFRYQESQQPLFSGLNMDVNRGDRISIVGPNGVGKTTLLKLVLGNLRADTGNIQYGTNVQIGYYDQEQTRLNSKKTVLQELWDEYPLKNEKDIRTVLGNFLFSGDDVLKTVSLLSGGEKARLSLAKLMMEKSNLLILDEPTNHLDLDSKEVLEAALIDYPGTIVFVSHDRYFINRLATQIIEMGSSHTTQYLGNYDYYIEKKQEEYELIQLEKSDQGVMNEPENQSVAKESYEKDKVEKREYRKIQRRIEQLEIEINENEDLLANNEELLCDSDLFQNHEKLLEITEENDAIKTKLTKLMEEWEELQIKLE